VYANLHNYSQVDGSHGSKAFIRFYVFVCQRIKTKSATRTVYYES